MEQAPNTSMKKVWESIQAYTVRCANCSKWRLVPTKEKYQEIREGITRHPFTCDRAKEWKPEISCDGESDVMEQHGDWRWAMDRPSIPQTPNGWQRILRIRAKGGTKFFDVYYVAPSNRRFRSMAELSRYLDEHPHYAQEGIGIAQFSFKSPVPLDENYVVKRPARPASSHDISANPTTLMVPRGNMDSQHDVPENTNTDVDAHGESSVDPMLWIVPYKNNNEQVAGPEITSEDAGPSRNANPRKRPRDDIDQSHEP